jgi:hypothetical protein
MTFRPSRKLLTAGALSAVLATAGAVSIAAASSGPGNTTAGSGASASTGTGTVTLSVTGLRGKTHTGRTRPVRCSLAGGRYTLVVGARRAARRARVTLIVPSYHGAGSYTGTLALRARVLLTRLQRTLSVPVTLTSTGGTVTITRTLPGTVHPKLRGKTVSATASWSCTA